MVECVFSQGRHLLPFICSRLSPSLFRALLCLSSWSRNDLVGIDDIVAAVSLTKKRKAVEMADVIELEE